MKHIVTLCRPIVWVAALLMGVAILSPSATQAVGVQLAPATANPYSERSGELLLAELNCVACHTADATAAGRLFSRTSPQLDGIGSRVTPQFLRSWLTSPHAEKPGTPMPDLLHGLNAEAKTEAVDALVHFLAAQTVTNATTLSPVHQSLIDQGRALYHSVGCVACHAPQDAIGTATTETVAALQANSVPLGPLAKKMSLENLSAFLQDPLRTRPSGRMPSLSLKPGEARAIAAYLLREQATHASANPEVTLPGLHYDYYEVSASQVSDLDKATPASGGSADGFSTSYSKRPQQYGLKFHGMLQVPKDATYVFFVTADDGAKLWIDGQVVVDNDGIHAPQEKSGKVALKAGAHSLALSFFNQGAGAELQVGWAEEGKQRRSIPSSVLSHSGRPMSPIQPESLILDAAKAARGKELFSSMGCVACHPIGNSTAGTGQRAPGLTQLKADQADGCLGSPRPGLPRFDLSTEQKAALKSVLAQVNRLKEPLSAQDQIRHQLSALNCYACHSRDGIGGPDQNRSEFFSTVDHADLGDEGRIPPHLTGVGGKLQANWLKTVLLNKGAARPYMATRMPQFGTNAIGSLPGLFETVDDPSAAPNPTQPPTPQQIKAGRQLVGTGGVSCIACHTFAKQKSLGIPAMDLTLMTQRLKRTWFDRYLKDPASLRPGTRMPSFWPDGTAVNQDILAGNTSQQIEAIWAYLSAGRNAKLPEGLTRIGQELVSTQEAVLYRHFIEGAGSRAIGVGYPEKANLAFDANQLRLALIWHGKFIDAAKHRQDRGAGYEGPLGDDVVALVSGAPFASLASADAPWPTESGKAAGYRMAGYSLDAQQRPTFRYLFGSIQVEDYPIAVSREPEPSLKRTITLRSEKPIPPLWFRAAIGERIEKSNQGYQVDGALTLRFEIPGEAQPVIRKNSGKQELLIPIQVTGNEARLVEEIVW
jgi:cytochrome c2